MRYSTVPVNFPCKSLHKHVLASLDSNSDQSSFRVRREVCLREKAVMGIQNISGYLLLFNRDFVQSI